MKKQLLIIALAIASQSIQAASSVDACIKQVTNSTTNPMNKTQITDCWFAAKAQEIKANTTMQNATNQTISNRAYIQWLNAIQLQASLAKNYPRSIQNLIQPTQSPRSKLYNPNTHTPMR